MAFEVRPLQRADDRGDFDCGESPLNTFFRRFAYQHQHKHGISTTWVAVEDATLGGFVTVTATIARRDRLPSDRNFPPLDLPALLIARLGTSVGSRGRGVGALLLRTTLISAIRMRQDVGCVGVLVDAKPDAVGFYARFGFAALAGAGPQTRMYMPYSAISDATTP